MSEKLWEPSAAAIAASNMTAFRSQVARDWQVDLADSLALRDWSVQEIENFWVSLWRYAEVIGDGPGQPLIDGDKMPGAHFFPDAKVNFAENLLRYSNQPAHQNRDAIVFWGEDKVKRRLSHG